MAIRTLDKFTDRLLVCSALFVTGQTLGSDAVKAFMADGLTIWCALQGFSAFFNFLFIAVVAARGVR